MLSFSFYQKPHPTRATPKLPRDWRPVSVRLLTSSHTNSIRRILQKYKSKSWRTKSPSPRHPGEESRTARRVSTTALANHLVTQPSSLAMTSLPQAWRITTRPLMAMQGGRGDTAVRGGVKRCWIRSGNERTSRTSGL